MEVRIVTRVRRIIQATRYDLRSDVAAVPCSAEGNPRIREFRVSLYRTVGSAVPELYVCTKIRYRRSSGDVYTAWVDASDVSEITVPTGMATSDKYDKFVIEAYHGDKMLTSLTVLTVLDGRIGNKGAQPRTRVWNKNDSYLQGKDDEQWYDISLYRDDDKSEYERYLCLVSHPPRNITPKDDVAQGLGFWGHATEYEFLATRLALAERIKADQIDANGLQAENVNIKGHLESTSGIFKDVEIYGSIKSNFEEGFTFSDDYADNVILENPGYDDVFDTPSILLFSLPKKDVKNVGRRMTFTLRQGRGVAVGNAEDTILWENGETVNSLGLNGGESAILLGYGTKEEFISWIILNKNKPNKFAASRIITNYVTPWDGDNTQNGTPWYGLGFYTRNDGQETIPSLNGYNGIDFNASQGLMQFDSSGNFSINGKYRVKEGDTTYEGITDIFTLQTQGGTRTLYFKNGILYKAV